MRSIILTFLACVILHDCMSQPPKVKKPPIGTGPQKEVISDTVSTKIDTVKMQYRVWVGLGYESYLARVNGYLVQRVQYGKLMVGPKIQLFYDDKWKKIKPEDIEPNLSLKLEW